MLSFESDSFITVCNVVAQGNVFTPVYHSVHGRGALSDRHSLPLGKHPLQLSRHSPGQTPPPPETATAADGTHPTGMYSCLLSVSLKLLFELSNGTKKIISYTFSPMYHLSNSIKLSKFDILAGG